MLFVDRADAGRRLAQRLLRTRSAGTGLVLAVPRGGVVVGYEIARRLEIPLDIVVARKIGAPFNKELAIGAVGADGSVVQREDLAGFFENIEEEYLEAESRRQVAEIERRLQKYRGGRPEPDLKGQKIILCDDGIATGYTIRAAIQYLWNEGVAEITLAVPVAPADTLRTLQDEVDHVVCLASPEPFYAVGQFYQTFDQTTDEEVIRLLQKACPAGDH